MDEVTKAELASSQLEYVALCVKREWGGLSQYLGLILIVPLGKAFAA